MEPRWPLGWAVMGTACLKRWGWDRGDRHLLLVASGFNPMWEETLVFTVHMPR